MKVFDVQNYTGPSVYHTRHTRVYMCVFVLLTETVILQHILIVISELA